MDYSYHLKLLPGQCTSVCEVKTSLPSVDHPVSRLGVLERKLNPSPALFRCEFLWIRAAEDECCSNVVGAENPGSEMVII